MGWICTDDNEFTKGGNLQRPSLSMVTSWVKEAWKDIPAEMVKKSFLKTGISNSMDVTEDDHLWQDSGESSLRNLRHNRNGRICLVRVMMRTLKDLFDSFAPGSVIWHSSV